jgi:hypothetical protein
LSIRRLEALDRERLVERLDEPLAEYLQFGGGSVLVFDVESAGSLSGLSTWSEHPIMNR